MNKSHLLINEQALQVLPSLAIALGLEEAIALQQLHYWLTNEKNEGRVDEDGNKWVYNTYVQWKEDNFPFWSEDQVKRHFLSLEKQGVVIAAQLDAKRRDMKKFYRIDYDLLCTMEGVKIAPSINPNLPDVKMNQRLQTENTTKKRLSFSEMQEIKEQANKKVDAVLEMSKGSENYWQGRENVRADLLHYADWYNKVTGQVMTKRAQKAWWKALPEWKEEGLTLENLQAAYDNRITWAKYIKDPNELTKDAAAIKAAGTASRTQTIYKPLKEDHNVYVPNPTPRRTG